MDPALVWIPPVTKEKSGEGTTLRRFMEELVAPAASRGLGGCAGAELPAGHTYLPQQHPCGIFWTIGAGNMIHRGRGVVVPESSRQHGCLGIAGDERAVPPLRLGPRQKMGCSQCPWRWPSPSIQTRL